MTFTEMADLVTQPYHRERGLLDLGAVNVIPADCRSSLNFSAKWEGGAHQHLFFRTCLENEEVPALA